MNKVLFAGAVLLTLGAAQVSAKTICSHGAETRVIDVVYSSDGQLPCEVQYTKSTGTQVLWSATNMVGYCEQKAEEFVAKQVEWGWDCESDTPAAVTEAPAEETPVEETPAADAAMEETPADEGAATE